MTDKELLELAAKAVGVSVKWVRNSGCFYYDNPETGHEVFDPLADDGDALRLAVRLGLQIDTRYPETHVYGARSGRIDEHHRSDPFAATRRAIVRAAAEIGRNME